MVGFGGSKSLGFPGMGSDGMVHVSELLVFPRENHTCWTYPEGGMVHVSELLVFPRENHTIWTFPEYGMIHVSE